MTNLDADDRSFWKGYADGEYDGTNGLPKEPDPKDAEYPESYQVGYAEGWHDGNMKRGARG